MYPDDSVIEINMIATLFKGMDEHKQEELDPRNVRKAEAAAIDLTQLPVIEDFRNIFK